MRRKCRPIPHSQRRASEDRIQLRDSLEKAELWGHKKAPRLLRAEETGKGVTELTPLGRQSGSVSSYDPTHVVQTCKTYAHRGWIYCCQCALVNNVPVWTQAISRPQQFSTLVVEEVVHAGCKGYSKMPYPLSGALKLTEWSLFCLKWEKQ